MTSGLSYTELKMSYLVEQRVRKCENGEFQTTSRIGTRTSYRIAYDYDNQKWIIESRVEGLSDWEQTNFDAYYLVD